MSTRRRQRQRPDPVRVGGAAFERTMSHVLAQELAVDIELTELSDVAVTWERLKRGAPHELIVTP